jgi:hypothetical protein
MHQIGGRYLFETWENVVDYIRFTSEELELEPGVKFWDRPFFIGVDKHAWHVIGAHDFAPMATHYANRLERFAYKGEISAMTSRHSGRCFAKRPRGKIWRVSGYCFSPMSVRLVL